jgi:hypothetical protein
MGFYIEEVFGWDNELFVGCPKVTLHFDAVFL